MEGLSIWEVFLAIATVVGASGASVVATRFARKSQAESNKINEANGLFERYSKLMEDVQAERDKADGKATHNSRQVSLWRRYANALRRQLQEAGIIPIEADNELDV